MIFAALFEAYQRNELIMIEGGFCRYHIRRDNVLVIHEILSSIPGAGTRILNILRLKNVVSIIAKCPIELPANGWYERRGFKLISVEGRLNVWAGR